MHDSLVRRANSGDPFVGFSRASGVGEFLSNEEEKSSVVNELSVLTDDAKELLIEASNDPSGHILKLSFIGGSTIQTNGKQMMKDNSPREKARWEAALNILINEDFVESVGYKNEIFVVSHYGYQIADKIKSA